MVSINKYIELLSNRQNFTEGLLESESNELRDWGTRIKNFSESYEETCRVYT